MELQFTEALVDDADNIARMAYSAGPELFEFVFSAGGKTALEFIAFEYRQGRGLCGHRNLTLAIKDDGEVVGTGAFYNLAEYLRMSLGTGRNILAFYGPVTGARVMARTRHISSVLRIPGLNEMYVCYLGVKETARGLGVGSRLLKQKKAVARQRGYEKMTLDVALNNPDAQRLYERLGFTVSRAGKTFSGKTDADIRYNEMEMPLQ